MSFSNLASIVFTAVWQTVWFYGPVIVANQFPGFLNKTKLPLAHTPVSVEKIGSHKQWGAYYAGSIGGLITILIQKWINIPIDFFDYSRLNWLYAVILGIIMGFGAVFGDHFKSFLKRKYGPEQGVFWWPWDQIDAILMSTVLIWPWMYWCWPWRLIIMLPCTMYFIHPVGNFFGLKFNLRKTWL